MKYIDRSISTITCKPSICRQTETALDIYKNLSLKQIIIQFKEEFENIEKIESFEKIIFNNIAKIIFTKRNINKRCNNIAYSFEVNSLHSFTDLKYLIEEEEFKKEYAKILRKEKLKNILE